MARQTIHLHALNVGQVDPVVLARIDLTKMRLAAETQENIIGLMTGAGLFRPGLQYLGSTASDSAARVDEFVRSANQSSLLEFSPAALRIWNDGVLVSRIPVTSTVTNGDFSSSTGWSTTGIGGGTATISGGTLTLNGVASGGMARCWRQVTTSTPGIEHALRIIVTRGPVRFRVGSTEHGDEYIREATLYTGEHSLAFTPTGSYWVEFSSTANVNRIVDSVQVEGSGAMSLPTPYAEADLSLIRTAQSADVVFVACAGHQQYRIERRSATSWSFVKYQANDGPFIALRTADVKLKPGALVGNTTLTASAAFFTEDHVGALFRLFHSGQEVSAKLASEGTYTDAIRVTGVTGTPDDRNWTYVISGTWSGTITKERSYDDEFAGYRPVDTTAVNVGSGTHTDTDDNAIIWYRFGFKPGDFTSGTANITIDYDGGGDYGICRVVGYTSPTEVDIEIIRPFAGTVYTDDWRESEWSAAQQWPSAVALHDGRLCWAGRDRLWLSVSDAFDSFDEEEEGDAAPIARSIAIGGLNTATWMMSLQRLIVGTDGVEASVRSSSLDEPLTATNMTIRAASTIGCASVNPAQVDTFGLFVDRSARKIYELIIDQGTYDYSAAELSRLSRKLLSSGVKEIAIARRPDTRIFAVMEDGSCVCIVYAPQEEVAGFFKLTTDGAFESVAVLPGDEQDVAYFVVRRTVDAVTHRYVERMALDSEAVPATLCKNVDSFVTFSQAPGTTVTGLDHLEGRSVVVWADGDAVTGTYTVTGGEITGLPMSVTTGVVGLAYRGRYKSGRLAYAAQGGTPLLQPKRVDHVGLLLTDFHRDGVKYGPEFDNEHHPLYDLPAIERGTTAETIETGTVTDNVTVPFNGTWSADSRICLEVNSPYPATLIGIVATLTTNDRL
jgi:hypothetical protein